MESKKFKRKTKLIIAIIVFFCIVISSICIFLNVEAKATTLTLSQTQINTDTDLLNEFMNSITTNNEDTYMYLTASSMKEESILKTLNSYFESYGKLKSLTYKEALKDGIYNNIIFNASFDDKNNVTLILTLNNDNKIVGIHV